MKMVTLKKLFKSLLCYSITIITLSMIFFYLFKLDTPYATLGKSNSLQLATRIFLRNTQNFLQYILLAPIMPLFYVIDCIYTSWSISLSLQAHGLLNTLSKLFPHGFIEIPNFCLYTYISFTLFKIFYSKKVKLKDYMHQLLSYKYIFMTSQLLILIAAILEGLLT